MIATRFIDPCQRHDAIINIFTYILVIEKWIEIWYPVLVALHTTRVVVLDPSCFNDVYSKLGGPRTSETRRRNR